MREDPTQWRPVEPTTPVTPHINPYEPSTGTPTSAHPDVFDEYIPIPPPPPNVKKHRDKGPVVLWVSLVIAVLLFASAILFYVARFSTAQVNHRQPTATVQTSLSTPTLAPTTQPSPTQTPIPSPTSTEASTTSVNIYDQANVLNADQVRSVASTLPNPINIYTTSTFTGDTSAFEQRATTHLTNPNLLVMAIDTNSAHHQVAIVGGSSVPLTQGQYDNATQAFVQTFQSSDGDYTASTIASLQSLHAALGSV